MGVRGYRIFATAGLVTGLLFASAFSSNVSAAETVDGGRITMSPVKQDYVLDAGSIKEDSFSILNDGDVAYTFSVYARPYSVKTTGYEADFTTNASNADVYQWVQFDKSQYDIKPGETIKVPFTIRVPSNATPGGHYGVLFAETSASTEDTGNAIARKKRVGELLYVTVKGTFSTGGNVQDPKIPFFQTRPPLRTSQLVKNTGNSHFTTTTVLAVSDVFGNQKYAEKRDYTVLPGTTRKIEMQWTNSPWFGLYKVDVNTKYLKKTTSDSGYVLLAPVWIYLVVVGLIVARVLYAVAQRRKA